MAQQRSTFTGFHWSTPNLCNLPTQPFGNFLPRYQRSYFLTDHCVPRFLFLSRFKRFNEVGVTVVVATHDVHLIEQFGTRRIVLGNGRVTDAGERAGRGEGAPIEAGRS